MALIVQKYGGSSVADAEKITNVARRVAETAGGGHQLVVVVSAMGKTTDGLIALARQVTPTPDVREMDMLLATGEQVTIALLAMALHGLGLRARSFTGGARRPPSMSPRIAASERSGWWWPASWTCTSTLVARKPAFMTSWRSSR